MWLNAFHPHKCVKSESRSLTGFMEEEITLVLARTCNFVTSTGPQLVGQLFLIFMIYGEEEAIVAPVVCPQFLY